jgi:hypothetical protein
MRKYQPLWEQIKKNFLLNPEDPAGVKIFCPPQHRQKIVKAVRKEKNELDSWGMTQLLKLRDTYQDGKLEFILVPSKLKDRNKISQIKIGKSP